MDDEDKHKHAHAVIELKKKLLAAMSGQPNTVQWLGLSDAVATFLAATGSKDKPATLDLRHRLLEQHVKLVKKLIPVNEEWLRKARERKTH